MWDHLTVVPHASPSHEHNPDETRYSIPPGERLPRSCALAITPDSWHLATGRAAALIGTRARVRGILCMVVLLLGARGALATTGHPFVFSLSEAPEGTKLIAPASVAIDRTSGHVFVGDPVTGYVDVYSSAGVFLTRFGGGMLSPAGVAVDESSGLVYVADSLENAVMVFGSDGSGEYRLFSKWIGKAVEGGEFGEVGAVAVNNSMGVAAGDVYVLDRENLVTKEGAVDVFAPGSPVPEEGREGSLVGVLAAGGKQEPNGVAVNSSDGYYDRRRQHQGCDLCVQ